MKHTSNNIRNDSERFLKEKKSYLTLDRYLLGVHHLARINNHCRSVDLPRASRQIEASYFFVPPYHQCCATPWHGPTCYLMCRDEVGNNFPCPNNRWWHKQHTHTRYFLASNSFNGWLRLPLLPLARVRHSGSSYIYTIYQGCT